MEVVSWLHQPPTCCWLYCIPKCLTEAACKVFWDVMLHSLARDASHVLVNLEVAAGSCLILPCNFLVAGGLIPTTEADVGHKDV